jgi:hypothetical protein
MTRDVTPTTVVMEQLSKHVSAEIITCDYRRAVRSIYLSVCLSVRPSIHPSLYGSTVLLLGLGRLFQFRNHIYRR